MSSEPSGRTGPHAFVDDLEAPQLDEDDLHHLARVVRLRAGDQLTVSDGRGRWRQARFGAEIEPDGPILTVEISTPTITIGFALVKGDRPEKVTQKLTELGVDVIRPFSAERSVVRWDARKATVATERLRRIAREAAMQCRRVRLPEIHEPVGFETVARLPAVVLAEREGPPLTLEHPTVLIGPEGGWSPDESLQVATSVGLGAHVLRADTAAIAAAVLLGAARAQRRG